MNISYRPAKYPRMYVASDDRGNVCGFVSQESMEADIMSKMPDQEQLPDTKMVSIEFWQQETAEFGSWKKTEPMPMSVAETILSNFYRGRIVERQT